MIHHRKKGRGFIKETGRGFSKQLPGDGRFGFSFSGLHFILLTKNRNKNNLHRTAIIAFCHREIYDAYLNKW